MSTKRKLVNDERNKRSKTVHVALNDKNKREDQIDHNCPLVADGGDEAQSKEVLDAIKEEMEVLLDSWIVEQNMSDVKLDFHIIRQKSLEIFNENCRKRGYNFKFFPGADWYRRFENKFKNDRISRLQNMINQMESETFRQEFEAIVQKHELTSKQVFCVTDMVVNILDINKTTIEDPSNNVTLVIGCNANGDCKLTPLLVHSLNINLPHKGYEETILLHKNKSGKLEKNVIRKWCKTYFAPFVSRYNCDNNLENKALLILDHSFGLLDIFELCHAHDYITLIFLPPKQTSDLQPMNHGVLKEFKHFYSTETAKLISKSLDINIRIEIILSSWKNIDQKVINKGWKVLWPSTVNEESVAEEQLIEEDKNSWKNLPQHLKRKVLKKFDNGETMLGIVQELEMDPSIVSDILDKKLEEELSTSDDEASPIVLQNYIPEPLIKEKFESLLDYWILENELNHVDLDFSMKQNKAVALFNGCKMNSKFKFIPSEEWYQYFENKFSKMRNLKKENLTSVKDNFKAKFYETVESNQLTSKQVFTITRTFCYLEQYAAFSDMIESQFKKEWKEQLNVILGCNAHGDCKLDPLFLHRSYIPAIYNSKLVEIPIIWPVSKYGRLTKEILDKWFKSYLVPLITEYNAENDLQNKAILIFDHYFEAFNVSELCQEYKNFSIMLLPPKTALDLQPMNQGVLAILKEIYFNTAKEHKLWSPLNNGIINVKKSIFILNSSWNAITNSNIEESWKELPIDKSTGFEFVKIEDIPEVQVDSSLIPKIENDMQELTIEFIDPVQDSSHIKEEDEQELPTQYDIKEEEEDYEDLVENDSHEFIFEEVTKKEEFLADEEF